MPTLMAKITLLPQISLRDARAYAAPVTAASMGSITARAAG
jgi:hypothetical protein